MATIAIIGGSGVSRLGDRWKGKHHTVETPWGKPSGPILEATDGKHKLLFVPRHGEGHTITPTELNSRANIFALKQLGAQAVLSISAVGSMREDIHPGDFVFPDQYVDVTRGARPNTFFGGGIVAHAPFADPACATWRAHLAREAKALGVRVHVGGTYVCVEGPTFSTRAESHLFRSWPLGEGREVAVIGMTAMPEARLAREARLCYQTVAMATDYDCWHVENADVSVEAILKVLFENADVSRNLIARVMGGEVPECKTCHTYMANAVVTPRELWPKALHAPLEIILR